MAIPTALGCPVRVSCRGFRTYHPPTYPSSHQSSPPDRRLEPVRKQKDLHADFRSLSYTLTHKNWQPYPYPTGRYLTNQSSSSRLQSDGIHQRLCCLRLGSNQTVSKRLSSSSGSIPDTGIQPNGIQTTLSSSSGSSRAELRAKNIRQHGSSKKKSNSLLTFIQVQDGISPDLTQTGATKWWGASPRLNQNSGTIAIPDEPPNCYKWLRIQIRIK